MAMRQGSAKPVLRLVHADEVGGVRLSSERNDRPARGAAARSRVERENRSAAEMSALDARWVFAVQVAREIEMSGAPRAGVLAPERRRNLVRLATRLGLRQFDANLVIAIVQDGCRTGEGACAGLSHGVSDRLMLVRSAEAQDGLSVRELAVWLVASACLAVTIGLALMRWISS